MKKIKSLKDLLAIKQELQDDVAEYLEDEFLAFMNI